MGYQDNHITPRNVRILALATTVVFELMAGPFVGYFSGYLLINKMKLPPVTMAITVFCGFILSFYAAMITIKKINDAGRKSDA
ncbi:MAG: AtpZ/AtpI family protein [Candidatus Omnitrophota bacterium]